MNNRELKHIIEQIEENEPLLLQEIAAKADVNRSHLSTLMNMEEIKEVSDRLVAKIKKKFPAYFSAKPTNQHIQQSDYDHIYVEKYIAEKEARRQESEAVTKYLKEQLAQAQVEKDKLFEALAKAQDVLIKTTEKIDTNLNQTHQQVLALKDQTYIVSRQLDDQREALGLGYPGEKKERPVPFVKKGKGAGAQQQDGGKKGSHPL